LDLLIKDAQLEDMIADLLATGQYKRVEQNLNYRWDDAYVKQVPRLRYTGEHAVLYSCLSLWSETVYMLSADAPMVEVPDVCAWNPVLVEDRLDPAAADVISISYKTRMAAGDQILPRALAQSLDTHVPVYVPSIPQFTDALLDQQRYRLSHAENYRSSMGTLPSYHLSNFVRYLHLEKKYQREKILPGLADRNKADMEKRLNKFKRKPLLKAPVPQVLR